MSEQQLASLKSRHDRLEREVRDLVTKVRFASALEDVTGRQTGLHQLKATLGEVEGAGYCWTGEARRNLEGIEPKGDAALKNVREEIDRAERDLKWKAESLERKVRELDVDLGSEGALHDLEGEQESLERLYKESERRIDAVSDAFTTPYDAAKREIDKAKRVVERFGKAGFTLQAGESPFAAIEASWHDSPAGEVKGFLFLSNLRIRFERSEKVAKKKFLFITTEAELIQELMLDEPVGNLKSSDDSTKGMVMKDQFLTFSWSGDAKVRGSTKFELEEGKAKDWDTVVEDIRVGGLERLKPTVGGSAPPPPPPTQAPRGPSVCAGCGAQLEQPVLGQTSVTCPYCGYDHPLQ